MIKKVWRMIPGFNNTYQVSNYGDIRRVNGKELICFETQKGYLRVNLSVNGKRTAMLVHRAVALAFLNFTPKDSYSMVIDHIDEDKKNNYVENLRIVTNRFNVSRNNWKRSSSSYVGVYWCKERKKWVSQIWKKNTRIWLGTYSDEDEAGMIYNNALRNIHLFDGDRKKFREKVYEGNN